MSDVVNPGSPGSGPSYQIYSEVLFPILLERREILDQFRQLGLRRDSDFITWVRKLGVQARWGYPSGDGERFWTKGWLRADAAYLRDRASAFDAATPFAATELGQRLGEPHRPADEGAQYELQFHPFRMLPLMRLLAVMEWNLSRTSLFYPEGLVNYAQTHVDEFKAFVEGANFTERLNEWNGIADLAILLEPLYWPSITSWTSGSMITATGEPSSPEAGIFREYKTFALGILGKIPKGSLERAHEALRTQAAMVDDNAELYLLMRASNWRKRDHLQGTLGGALWIRHVAEVLRRGHQELYENRLPDEDVAFGMWYQGAREWLYGSEYPLDNHAEMVRRTLPHWGLLASPRVRFYVEGETEEGALEAGLEAYLGYAIEVVNLRAQGWATWLRQELQNDVAAKRISLFMLDRDQDDPIRALKAHAREGLIVGMVFINEPDLETGCFTTQELLRAATIYEEASGLEEVDPLEVADFEGSTSGKDFEKRYCHSRHVPSLKGKSWGAALMRAAFESKRGEKNTLVHAWACASRATTVDYTVQKNRYPIDPDTLANHEVRTGGMP